MQDWQKWIISSKKSSYISKCGSKPQGDISNNFIAWNGFLLLPEEILLFYSFAFCLEVAFIFIFLLNKMFGLVLKDVESKYNRINKWLFIYKQQELLMVTGRKLNPEMINSVCSTVFGRVFCIALGFKKKQIA